MVSILWCISHIIAAYIIMHAVADIHEYVVMLQLRYSTTKHSIYLLYTPNIALPRRCRFIYIIEDAVSLLSI
jgi:hypothetical protein